MSVSEVRRRLPTYARAIRKNATLLPFEAYNLALWLPLHNQRYFPPSVIAGGDVLVEHWEEIRAELDALLAEHTIPTADQVDEGQVRLSEGGTWKTFFFCGLGNEVPSNQALCPRTAELLGHVPDLYGAMFSVLEPRAELALHTGPTKGTYRMHLPLVVPDVERCWLEIGGERRHWREGEPIVFDEGYPHRARNGTDERRVVLILDVIRPMPWRWLDRLNREVLLRLSRMQRFQAAAERAVVR